MIRDWDLWPWIVAEAADESGHALAVRRLEQHALSVQRAIAAEFYPILRRTARILARMVAQT